MPPTTTMAKGRWVWEPMRVEKAAGNSPKIAAKAVMVRTLALAHGADYLVRMNGNKAGVGQEGTGGMQFPQRD